MYVFFNLLIARCDMISNVFFFYLNVFKLSFGHRREELWPQTLLLVNLWGQVCFGIQNILDFRKV